MLTKHDEPPFLFAVVRHPTVRAPIIQIRPHRRARQILGRGDGRMSLLRAVAARPSTSAVFDGRRARAYRLPRAAAFRRVRAIDADDATIGDADADADATPTPETLDAFATRVCERIGRGEADAIRITDTLRANWFETVADVADLSVDQLAAMAIPARFSREMALVLREDEAAAARRAASASNTASTSSSLAAAADGWIGGPLPGPDARLPRPVTGRAAAASRGAPALSDVRVTKRKRLPPYALRDDEIPASLAAELVTLRRDVTSRRVGGGRAPVRHSTADNYVEVARGLMGWLVRVKRGGWDGVAPASDTRNGAPVANAPDGLSLRDAIPSDEAEGAALAIEYLQWLCEARGIMPTTEAFQLRSLIALAKWLHGEGDLEKPVVMELVRVQRGSKTLATKGSHAADEAAKWLDWPDYLRLVETLKLECAPLNHAGDQRPDRDVAMAVQRYLLFAILACVPDRQRTLRELELGRTLVCEETDEILDDSEAETGTGTVAARRRRWTVQHAPEDYKTGGAYGARPALVLDPRLYPALEAWLFGPEEDDVPSDPDSGYSDWGFRAALAPSHDRVFTRPNGEAWTVSELSRTFSRAAMRLTGKKTNPHLVRDMVITHVRGEGLATDAELEALSLYMGHSVAMQKGTYDRRTQQQKVAPAVGLMSAINARAAKRDAER